MSKFGSPYYPPRARWYSPLRSWGELWRRRVDLDRLHLPGVSIPGALASLLVPGLGFYVRGQRYWGLLAMGASLVLAVVFLTELGRPAANICFGLLLSLHAMSLNFVFEPWMTGARFRFRMGLALAVLVCLGALIYMPLRGLIQERWATPLLVKDRVVIVSKQAVTSALKRGDWVAFSWPQTGDHGGYIQAGFGLAPVLAVAGDQVTFTSAGFKVNGVLQPARANMPESGELTVAAGHCFIWPDIEVAGHGYGSGLVTQLMLQLSNVSDGQIAGKPFHRWFWHRQFDL